MNSSSNNNTEYDYRQFIVDDYDSDHSDGFHDIDDIDTSWIYEYETKIMNDDYQLFLKSDITRIGFEFYYLNHDKTTVERIVPMSYSLREINKISQNELFSIVRSHQYVDKKYYNFQSLLLYSFDFHDNCKDIVRSLSNYIQLDNSGCGGDVCGNEKSFIEYTNILSIDVIYFRPLITMFHEFLGFSVLLYED